MLYVPGVLFLILGLLTPHGVLSFTRFQLRTEVEIQRKAERTVLNRKQRAGTKARDIQKAYPPSKADALIKKLHTAGLWYWDPDFPKDEEERI